MYSVKSWGREGKGNLRQVEHPTHGLTASRSVGSAIQACRVRDRWNSHTWLEFFVFSIRTAQDFAIFI